MYTLSAFTCGPNMWYQNRTQADEPSFLMVGLTNPAVSFGLRGYDVSIYMYQPFPEGRQKKQTFQTTKTAQPNNFPPKNKVDRRCKVVELIREKTRMYFFSGLYLQLIKLHPSCKMALIVCHVYLQYIHSIWHAWKYGSILHRHERITEVTMVKYTLLYYSLMNRTSSFFSEHLSFAGKVVQSYCIYYGKCCIPECSPWYSYQLLVLVNVQMHVHFMYTCHIKTNVITKKWNKKQTCIPKCVIKLWTSTTRSCGTLVTSPVKFSLWIKGPLTYSSFKITVISLIS